MISSRRLFWIGLAVALLVAVGLSQLASSSPDGLEFVAEEQGFADDARDHDLADSPLAEYGEDLTSDDRVNTAVAGLIGTLATLALGYGVFWLVRRNNQPTSDPH